jgi:hypothetical protein
MRSRSIDRRRTLPECVEARPTGAQQKTLDLKFAIPAAVAAAGLALLVYEIVSR